MMSDVRPAQSVPRKRNLKRNSLCRILEFCHTANENYTLSSYKDHVTPKGIIAIYIFSDVVCKDDIMKDGYIANESSDESSAEGGGKSPAKDDGNCSFV